MTDLSIILVSYNTRELLRDCLRSVEHCRDEAAIEVFVVDNDSRDGSQEMVSLEFPWARLIANSANVGFAAANNQAMRIATGRFMVLLNSDTLVRPGAFREVAAFMDRHPRAGYCGPKLLNADGSHQPSARRFPTVLSTGASMLGLCQRFPDSRHTSEPSTGHLTQPCPVDWLSGACLVVRSEVTRTVGLMDEGFFLYFEETDWCRRIATAGWEGWYVPSGEIVHFGGQSVVHRSDARPFEGAHPVHWVNSSRRYMRRHHGWAGQWTAQLVEVGLYAAIWLRHRWRSGEASRAKAGNAAAAIRYWLTPPSRPRSSASPEKQSNVRPAACHG